jgi:hypothetical protein
MRYRTPELLLGCLLTIAVFAIGMLFASSIYPYPPSANPEHSAQNHPQQETSKPSTDERLADYTWWLAVLTGGLVLTAVGQGFFIARSDKTAQKAADAAILNAEALISAERAHLFVIVKGSNLHEALRGSVFYGDSNGSMLDARIPRPELEFAIKNTGRTAAIIQDISYQLIQAEAETTLWEYADQGTIVNAVIEGGDETSPPTPCIVESDLTIASGNAVLNGSRPLYFYGFVIFRDTFKRRYQYYWRHEYRGRRFVLVYEEEHQIEA